MTGLLKWARDVALGTVCAFAVFTVIGLAFSFIAWKLPNPNWLGIIRLSVVIGVVLAVFAAAGDDA